MISFSDGTRKIISAAGEEEIKFPDNTVVIMDTNGDRIVKLAQGDNNKRNVRKSLKTTLERRIERRVSLASHNRDVMVL